MSTKASELEPVGRIIERNVGAGFGMIELAEGEEAALRDDWGDLEGRVRIQSGRIGIESAASNHYPEVQVNAWSSEPPVTSGSRRIPLETLGTWPVVFKSRQVQVWSGDSYPGDELPLDLAKSKGGRYLMRISVGHRDLRGRDLDDYVDEYYADHDEAPRGVERFVIDFWPTR